MEFELAPGIYIPQLAARAPLLIGRLLGAWLHDVCLVLVSVMQPDATLLTRAFIMGQTAAT